MLTNASTPPPGSPPPLGALPPAVWESPAKPSRGAPEDRIAELFGGDDRPSTVSTDTQAEHDAGAAADPAAISDRNRLGHALRCVEKGWPVFPLAPRSKVPPKGSHGFKAATRDPAVVRGWFEADPTINYGIATGFELVVLDEDKKHAGWEEGRAALGHAHEIAATFSVRTPSGGHHYYFKKGSVEIRNRAGFVSGHDVRGDGGYVVGPGSFTEERWEEGKDGSKVQKAWRGEYTVQDWAKPIAPLPTGLGELMLWKASKKQDKKKREKPHGSATPSATAAGLGGDADVETFGTEPIPAGARNASLTTIAGRQRRLGATEDEILDFLTYVNEQRCSPTLPDEEIEQIARSVSRYEPASAPVDLASLTSTFTLDELGTAPPPVAFVVNPYIPAGKPTLLAAAGGTGKSTLIAKLAISITTGTPFFGCEVDPGTVVIVTAEDDREDYRRRLYPLTILLDAEEVALVERRLIIIDLGGTTKTLVEGGHTPKVSDFADDLGREIARIAPGAKLIIFETMSKLSFADENANNGVACFVAAVERVASYTGAAALISHHTSKESARKAQTDAAAGRGGSALADNCRSVMVLAAPSKPGDVTEPDVKAIATTFSPDALAARRLLILRHAKSNHARAAPLLAMKRVDGPLLVPISPGPELRRDAATAFARRLADLAAQAPDLPLSQKLLKKKANWLGVTQGDVPELLNACVRDGLVEVYEARGARGGPFTAYRPKHGTTSALAAAAESIFD